MESSESSPFDSLKSKKILNSASKSSPSDQTTKASDQSPWSTKTPEKPTNLPRRVRNRRTVMSVKEVRQIAEKIRKSDQERPRRLDPISSARQQIASCETPVAKSKKLNSSMMLPEKYEILGKFFDSLDSSIRLLRLKGSMPTFTKISPKIECLTDRRFSYNHLAQLKYILPEVIEIKKVLMRDEQTNYMKPDLHVMLNVSAIGNDGKLETDSGNSHMRKVFRARLLDFYKAHPEGDEVPKETLPEPFNQSKQDLHTEHMPTAASHLSQSFQRHFSQKVSSHESVNINQVLPDLGPHYDHSPFKEETSASAALSPIKISSKPTTSEKSLALGASPATLTLLRPPATPVKERDSTKNEDCSSMGTAIIQGTPAKLISTPVKLMSATTPALQPPKRCCMSPDDDSTSSPSKLVRRPPRSRSLKFDTPVKNTKGEDEVNEIGGLSVDNDIFEILPENLLQSIREKERKAIEEKDPAISQAKWRQQMIASLPKIFDMIRFLFQSIKRSVITKEELMHRIIASHLEIVDRREVEEQLRLLQELAPEWIYEKLASTGDLLLCINKIASPESIRARLAEAK
uniref:CDT1 Geminin-binding domain-containing protein n=1 Tax=Davidia involucrata TaxID=16924 RepID=A0A5B6YPF4_DAVIN